ncbi:MAG: NADH-quinone oxidoreductase subunit N, partial [candidate division NC10 bacterium]|nr:NADH-quinone oxidoreductase subunit N [candidate division NC10 bacterium]
MSATFNPADVWLLLPELTVAGCATAVLILDFSLGERVRTALGWLSVAGLLGAGVLVARQVGQHTAGFSGMLLVDPFAIYFKAIFLVATLLIILMAMPYLTVEQVGVGEFYAITLYATAAMMLMGAAGNLLSLYVALETMSVSIYVLCGYLKRDQKSNEAALKYLLMGAFSSGVILYGMVMLYGLTGTLDLREVGTVLRGVPLTNPALVLGMVMLTAGFGFKIAMVPFHMY